MKYFILVVSLFMNGCFYQKVDTDDILKSIKLCGSPDKIHHLTIKAGGFEYVKCINGDGSTLDDVTL